MLVLTRRADQKIVFPTVGITIDVLRIKGNVVKIGIEAPTDIQVLRHEIAEGLPPETFAKAGPPPVSRDERHNLRNRLNAATLALHLLRRQLDTSHFDDAESTLLKIVEEFGILEKELNVATSIASRGTALVVEDDRNECELLAGFLRLSGFDVTAVADGADALEHLASNGKPDVVLLDMLMPRCNGARTVEIIRRNPQFAGLKVFAISGTAPSELGVSTGPRGVDRWFAKPINPETLVSEMRRELATHGAA